VIGRNANFVFVLLCQTTKSLVAKLLYWCDWGPLNILVDIFSATLFLTFQQYCWVDLH